LCKSRLEENSQSNTIDNLRGLVSLAGWFLQEELSWCSSKEVGVSCRLVPVNIVVELVLSQGDWCLPQVGTYKYYNSRLVPTKFL
jgi:hypothetical protein